MTADERREGSARARSLLEEQAVWLRADAVVFFAPMPEEVDLWALAEKALGDGKTVGLPRFNAERNQYSACAVSDLKGDVKAGRFGIVEAGDSCSELTLKRLDLILVPGLAFDSQGRRLGRGKGYYDQWLATVQGKTCGVAYDEQIEREIPVEPHDKLVDCILTPTRWICCSQRAVLE